MYHIVNFSECNEVELVPSNWVSNGVCAWPPYKTGDIHKAIINKEQPKENWKSFKVEVMYTTGFPLYPEKGHGGLLEPIPAGCKAGTNPRQGSSPSQGVKQEMMMEQVKVILKTVQDLHEKCCSDSGSDPVLEKDILPLQDLTSIELFFFLSVNLWQITLLGIQGGIDVRDTVWRIMRQTLTNSLDKQLNWRGINGKTCFHSLHIKDIVIETLTSRATTQEIEMWIKRWLHLAADRDGGRRARMERQRKNSYQESGEHYQPSNTSSKKLIRKLYNFK
uniref:DUF4806 domain-containing protein n=1 Tax=Erpetoichthys calabaricus TaxID=27687 RepID=A0A8C4RML7_ERPCA